MSRSHPPEGPLSLGTDHPRPRPRSYGGGCVNHEGGTFACTDCVFDKCSAGSVRAAQLPPTRLTAQPLPPHDCMTPARLCSPRRSAEGYTATPISLYLAV